MKNFHFGKLICLQTIYVTFNPFIFQFAFINDITDANDLKCYEEFKRAFPEATRDNPNDLHNHPPHMCDMDVRYQLRHSIFHSDARIFDPKYTPVLPNNPDNVNLTDTPVNIDGWRNEKSIVYKGVLFTDHGDNRTAYRGLKYDECIDIINSGCLIEVNYRWKARRGIYHVNLLAKENGIVVYDPVYNEVITAYKMTTEWSKKALDTRLEQRKNHLPVDIDQLKAPVGCIGLPRKNFEEALNLYGDKWEGKGNERRVVKEADVGFENACIKLGRSKLTHYLGNEGKVKESVYKIPGFKENETAVNYRIERNQRKNEKRASLRREDSDGFITVK
jgi:hypothetical protein